MILRFHSKSFFNPIFSFIIRCKTSCRKLEKFRKIQMKVIPKIFHMKTTTFKICIYEYLYSIYVSFCILNEENFESSVRLTVPNNRKEICSYKTGYTKEPQIWKYVLLTFDKLWTNYMLATVLGSVDTVKIKSTFSQEAYCLVEEKIILKNDNCYDGSMQSH